MTATRTFLFSDEGDSDRLDRVLADEYEDLSRERIKSLIQEGMVSVNETIRIKPAYHLKENDRVVLTIPDAQPVSLVPENIPLDVVYEDTDLLVVNKPSGMLTHPTGKVRVGTLVNALLHHCGDSLSGINGVIRPGIVHRLDRDTSGLLVVAKNDKAHLGLSAQLKDRSMKRTYKAIVQGKFQQPAGMVSVPIGRHPKQRDKMMVDLHGRPSVTHWHVLETIADKFALLQLNLETGRTHQIRVHMAHIGHPVLGDPLYGSGVEKIMKLQSRGQLLQAVRLELVHPATGEAMRFEVPDDREMVAVWEHLRLI